MENFDDDPEVIQAKTNAKKRAAAKQPKQPFTSEQEAALNKLIQDRIDSNAKKSRAPTNKRMDEKLDELSTLVKTYQDKQQQGVEKLEKLLTIYHAQNRKASQQIFNAIRTTNYDKPKTPTYQGGESSRSSPENSPN